MVGGSLPDEGTAVGKVGRTAGTTRGKVVTFEKGLAYANPTDAVLRALKVELLTT